MIKCTLAKRSSGHQCFQHIFENALASNNGYHPFDTEKEYLH